MASEGHGLPQRLYRSEFCIRVRLQSCRKTLPKRSRALAPAAFHAVCDLFSTCSVPRKQLFFQILKEALSNAIGLDQ
jgi:hypothetical protein